MNEFIIIYAWFFCLVEGIYTMAKGHFMRGFNFTAISMGLIYAADRIGI